MIDYIQVHDLQLGPLTIHPFGLLVATGVLMGVELAKHRGRALGLPAGELASFIGWMLFVGFVGGHVLDELFYHPHEAVERPWSLLFIWQGLSSFGGFTGGLLGVLMWRRFNVRHVSLLRGFLSVLMPTPRPAPLSMLPYCDVILAVFPVAWFFGRLGCTVVHDHPGMAASPSAPLAVAYGAGPTTSWLLFDLRHGNTPRYDLGLLEMLFSLAVAIVFATTWRKRLPMGWYVAILPLVYAPVRFGLDFLRLDDPHGGDLRYSGFTPAQWACIALFGFALFMTLRLTRTADAPGAV